MKYSAVQACRWQFSVALMCRLLDVSRSGFYAAGKRAASARAKCDEQLRRQIRAVYQQSRRTYGSPRVHAELQAQGERCGRKRVARLMRQDGLRVKRHRRFRRRTFTRSPSWRIKRAILLRPHRSPRACNSACTRGLP